MDRELVRLLEKQHYRIIGAHSAVKVCHWMRQKLFYGRSCYKESFYGIQTHRCLQFTPAALFCTQNCLFCWREQQFSAPDIEKWDEPSLLLENAILAHRKLISGFKGDKRCELRLWKEAQNPNQVAISLTGEPMLYPELGEFIALCKRKGMTTFLVTNGTQPEKLETLSAMPTQLYVTLAAPNKQVYERLCLPLSNNCWHALTTSLALLRTLNTRTVIRLTLVENWNLGFEEEYARLIETAEPKFIEAKGYMFIGSSRYRLSLANMPSHEKIRNFSHRLAELTGYKQLAERSDSRVVLLGR